MNKTAGSTSATWLPARARLNGMSLKDVQVLFRMQPKSRGSHHFGSRLVIDRDNYLYITLGERGERPRAQDLNDHGGSVIRLHDDGRIPADNPFVNRADAKPEIYSYGHRNPQGLTLNPQTGEVWEDEDNGKLVRLTRPNEMAAMADDTLKQAAGLIDDHLNQCRYQTIVHGDAKVANFCFSPDGRAVAAVDFQYVGGGCGMKDVAYFLGSCLNETQYERWQTPLLDYYFSQLRRAINIRVDFDALEKEWRELFPYAWTDFYRFLLGWAPGHWKVNPYSQRLAEQVLKELGL